MPIDPDTKDWTWVLERRCDECGFDASTLRADVVAQVLRGNVIAWRPLLLADDGTPRARVAERPSDDRWSSLEYARRGELPAAHRLTVMVIRPRWPPPSGESVSRGPSA
jgi:hypothetical protein